MGQRLRPAGPVPGWFAAEQATAREQALWWTEHANLTFEFGNEPDAEIRISFDPDDGAWSYVGTDCPPDPGQRGRR